MKPVAVLPALLLAGLLAEETPAQLFRADLNVTDFSLSTTDFREGTEIEWRFTVRNIGTAASGPFSVGFYLSDDATITPSADWRLHRAGNPSLGVGQFSNWVIRIVVPQVNPWLYYAGPYADDTEIVSEYLEVNNYDRILVQGIPLHPDLEVTTVASSTWSVRVGTPVRLTATVRNIGERPSLATTATFYLSKWYEAAAPSGSPLGTVPVPVLAVNQSIDLPLDVTVGSLPQGGDAYWAVQVTPNTSPSELIDWNNNRSQWVRCQASPNVDDDRTLQGPASSQFGQSVADAGDVDGDGSSDLIVGLPLDDTAGPDAGAARVFSGRTGALLWNFPGPSAGANQGDSVAGAGDVDGDGVPDLVVGARLAGYGRATLYSGRTGNVIRFYEGEGAIALLGRAVAGVGDVDGDGYDDVAITVPGDSSVGSVRVYSGRTGARVFIFFGPLLRPLGQAVAGAGDVNRDGFPDVIVGAPGEGSTGAAYVLSGRTGELLRRLALFGGNFGSAVCGTGDVDADGYPDLAVGAPGYASNAGRVALVSGRTFGLLHVAQGWQPNEYFGGALSGAGDVNGDGTPDLLVGAVGAASSGDWTGRAAVLSGRDLTTLFSFVGGAAGYRLGESVALIRDVNDDGRADLLVGSPGSSAARLLHTLEKTIGRSSIFGGPGATSGGLRPRAVLDGSPQIGTTVSLGLRAAPPATLALMLLGFARADVDLGPSGAPGNRLYTFPSLVLQLLTGPDGRVSLPIALPDEPGLVGVQAFLQWAVSDPPANALGYVASDAARIVIGRL